MRHIHGKQGHVWESGHLALVKGEGEDEGFFKWLSLGVTRHLNPLPFHQGERQNNV